MKSTQGHAMNDQSRLRECVKCGASDGCASGSDHPKNQGRMDDRGSAIAASPTAPAVPRSILSKNFKYVNADNTSVARTFARVRRALVDEQRKRWLAEIEQAWDEALCENEAFDAEREAQAKVRSITRKKANV